MDIDKQISRFEAEQPSTNEKDYRLFRLAFATKKHTLSNGKEETIRSGKSYTEVDKLEPLVPDMNYLISFKVPQGINPKNTMLLIEPVKIFHYEWKNTNPLKFRCAKRKHQGWTNKLKFVNKDKLRFGFEENTEWMENCVHYQFQLTPCKGELCGKKPLNVLSFSLRSSYQSNGWQTICYLAKTIAMSRKVLFQYDATRIKKPKSRYGQKST
jgi:hypothetical protein